MNEPDLETLVRATRDRRSASRLLRGLGFPDPLRDVRVPGTDIVTRVAATSRATIVAFLVELRDALRPGDVRATARALRALDGARHHVLVLGDPGWSSLAVACDAPAAGTRVIVLDPRALRAADIDVLRELTPEAGEGDSAAALRLMRALDRSRVTTRFFRDVVSIRDRISRTWSGLPPRATADRDALALLLLSRLMFLYFLQRRGLLAGDRDYLPRLLRTWTGSRAARATSFYRGRLVPLFFGALNRRPDRRDRCARALGDLPYLNGGLFELHRLEAARPHLDLPDEAVALTFGELLEKYRFTTSHADNGSHDVADSGGVDPGMLGRIFEGLMPGERRERTGTFYTPAATVDRVVEDTFALHLAAACDCDPATVRALAPGAAEPPDDAVKARIRDVVAGLKVLDPACGSGAFLLGALSHMAVLRRAVGACADPIDLRRDIVGSALHGVDLLEDAALICSLRLWLTLVPQCDDVASVPPLPNLDRRIRQGDALVDPLDIRTSVAGRPLAATAPPELRALTRQLEPISRQYLAAGPETRPALRAELARIESAVAQAWLAALGGRLDWEIRDLEARAADRDLFGDAPTHAKSASQRLERALHRRAELDAFGAEVGARRRLPFFSFRVHFAEVDAGFDIIVSNPPWVRAHRWPPATRQLLRERYRVCEDAGWAAGARLTGTPAGAGAQVDLSLLFLERSIELLRSGGTLGMLLPAKLFRSLYAAGARKLLAETTHVRTIEDHSLDHRTIFDADAFTSVLIAQKAEAHRADDRAGGGRRGRREGPGTSPPVRVTLHRQGREALHFCADPADLPLVPGDARSPWLLVPPGCRSALRTMQRNGTMIGELLTIRRGVMTGANDVLVVRDVEPKLGDLARIRTDGHHRAISAQGRRAFTAWVEASTLRPALRGADIAAWSARPSRHVLWTPHNDDAAATAPPRLKRYLKRHRARLRQQDHEIGALHRLSPYTTGHKVVWSDLAADLRAAAVPPLVRDVAGTRVPVIPLNSVYFIATADHDESGLLAAYLNSLPLRVFARAIAERAKDAHFRFFAWTIAVLPLPLSWRDNAQASRLVALSADAHRTGSITCDARAELDALVVQAYGIDAAGAASLAAFDGWLCGGSGKEGV